MNLSLVLDMALSGHGDRPAIGTPGASTDVATLDRLARGAAALVRAAGADALVYIGTNHLAFPVCMFGAARAGVPLIPLNYRLSSGQLDALLAAHPGALVVHDGSGPAIAESIDREVFVGAAATGGDDDVEAPDDAELPAVLLYTSGTTAAPKAAVLRHRHLLAYLFATVEFGAAQESDAALVTVPPYHIAGVTNLLSNLYAGRRLVYLDSFDAAGWLDVVRAERVTQAMVVPTMLARIVDLLDERDSGTPALRTLSYGGARMPLPVLERALALFPDTGFVNAYGLTETSSTIALLGPDEHREAAGSSDPAVRARLGSVGQLVPGIELEVRDEDGRVLPAGETGLLFLRGEQVSGEYAGSSAVDADGWFSTRDRGRLGADGFLFIEGRADDTIIRGGENIAPAEIEDTLLSHPEIVDAVVVGVPDDEWGQRLVAVVVPAPGSAVEEEALRDYVRERLRSAKTPDRVEFRDELPRTDTGKLLRRQVLAELTA